MLHKRCLLVWPRCESIKGKGRGSNKPGKDFIGILEELTLKRAWWEIEPD